MIPRHRGRVPRWPRDFGLTTWSAWGVGGQNSVAWKSAAGSIMVIQVYLDVPGRKLGSMISKWGVPLLLDWSYLSHPDQTKTQHLSQSALSPLNLGKFSYTSQSCLKFRWYFCWGDTSLTFPPPFGTLPNRRELVAMKLAQPSSSAIFGLQECRQRGGSRPAPHRRLAFTAAAAAGTASRARGGPVRQQQRLWPQPRSWRKPRQVGSFRASICGSSKGLEVALKNCL